MDSLEKLFKDAYGLPVPKIEPNISLTIRRGVKDERERKV